MSEYTTTHESGESMASADNQRRLSNSGVLSHESPSEQKADKENRLESPPYYHEKTHEEWPGVVASIDMMRQSLDVRADRREWLIGHLDMVMSDSIDHYTANRVGKYQYMWTYTFGDATATVAYGLVGTNKTDFTKGFFEFNPNKLGDVKAFYGIRRILDEAGVKFSTSRFDVAFDMPGERRLYQLVKDRRKYEYHNGGAVSEYLGRRNHIGRVKLYDKTKESNLTKELTRLEITVGESFDSAIKAWPHLVGLETIQGMTSTNSALALALKRLAELGEPIEPYLSMLDRRTKSRLMKVLKAGFRDFPLCLMAEMYKQAKAWNELGALPPNE